MKIIMTSMFKKSAKKLFRHQIEIVEKVIEEIADKPEIGILKKGDLAGIRIHKFYIKKQLMLLAYQHSKKEITLLSLNSHENFYRNLKNYI